MNTLIEHDRERDEVKTKKLTQPVCDQAVIK